MYNILENSNSNIKYYYNEEGYIKIIHIHVYTKNNSTDM